LLVVAAVFSAMVWLALMITLVGLVYGPAIACGVLVARAFFIARVQNDGVRVGPTQLPDLYERVVRASTRLGLAAPPEVYVMQGHGILNAFATTLFSRRFVLLNAELLTACHEIDDGGSSLDFVIGHEIGHLALGHLSFAGLLAPARVMPLLGPAYSRACEYSCDACGLAVVGDDIEAASRALAMLAAGGRVARQIDLDVFVSQVQASGGLIAGIIELNSSHPYLPKRVAALRSLQQRAGVPSVARPFLAYPLAPLFNTGFAIGLVYVGVLAAIAVPNFMKFRDKARAQGATAEAPEHTAPEAQAAAANADDAAVPTVLVRLPASTWLAAPDAAAVPGLAAGELQRIAQRAAAAGATEVVVIAAKQGDDVSPLGVAVGLPAEPPARKRLIKLCTQTWNTHGTEGACVDDGSDEFVFDFRPAAAAAPAPTPTSNR